MKKIQIKSTLPPAIVKFKGRTVVMAGNVTKEVPAGTTLKDIEWINTSPKLPKKRKTIRKTFPSSSGKGSYTLTHHPDGRIDCSCPGFTYRRSCKHCDMYKKGKDYKG